MDYYYAYGEDSEFDEKPPKSLKTEIFEWLDVLVVSVIAVVLIFTFFFRVVTIDGESMENTLHSGERVMISDMFYTPMQGDIVVISRNTDNSLDPGTYSEPIIKRIIATEGQTVNIDFETGKIYVDGYPLEEDYTKNLATNHIDDEIDFPAYVPENCVFVLGDNRRKSLDSRSARIGKNGMIDERYILGKAVYRIFPLKKMGGLD
ncbi:MAG: signal peptidase I [Clostridia bacterium]|nr:signal peptidase I [Clostridia bacterium]